ncbi:U32 family peptidase [Porphyromonas pogonae]|uniref:peptidase U32 family protein n=1 Tax=Porphyromonas pogonae TaxID=867595 RepID=UPI002E793D9E|nr:U32 family peptidase [Porphyromonas pogonae]
MAKNSKESKIKELELLAPAKDLDTAREAILHGADAIYIGAPRFGARAAAGVTLQDIATLTHEAHRFNVKIYVTLNTILFENEMEDAQSLIWDLYHAGADALIIQDMGILSLDLPPIPLHASTQCNTRTVDDVITLESLGFTQVVLARELNIEEITTIASRTTVPLEVFVHGALCVSLSGQCYLSQAIKGRSANRGECAQMCRLPYTLIDADDNVIIRDRHLLSPKDLNRSTSIDRLIEAGASSFKIEGRLKGQTYVKNITAHYRNIIDAYIADHPEGYKRSSCGTSVITFQPNPAKSFNRGFTDFYFHKPTHKHPNQLVINAISPKSIGEPIGIVKECKKGIMKMDATTDLHNGDGIYYVTQDEQSGGAKINTINAKGVIGLNNPINLPAGTRIYRNLDHKFERQLSSPTAERKLRIDINLRETPDGFALDMCCPELQIAKVTNALDFEHQPAKKFDRQRIQTELGKLGNTIFTPGIIEISLDSEPFIPMSLLGELRRETVESLLKAIDINQRPCTNKLTQVMKDKVSALHTPSGLQEISYLGNVSNSFARKHYLQRGYKQVAEAYELNPSSNAILMFTKHCLRRQIGYCNKENTHKMPFKEPLFLLQDGNKMQLSFDCKECMMHITLCNEKKSNNRK